MPKKEQKSIEEPISRELFEVLACPLCKAGLEYTTNKMKMEFRYCCRQISVNFK